MNLSSLYKRPTPRQEFINGKFVKHNHGEEEESESWVELFIDLVYVSLLYKLGSLLVSCYQERFIIGRVVVLFGNLILTRFAIDEYANRFYSHDLVHKTIYFIYIIGVFVQVLNINTSSHSEHHCVYVPDMSVGIISGIIINKLAIISVHLLVMYHNPDAKFQFMSDIIRWSISTVIMVINLILHYNDIKVEWVDFTCLLVLIVQEFLIWIVSRSFFRKFYKFPIDLELFQTRWGIWVMIVIGESVLQLLVHQLNIHRLSHDYCFTLFSLTILFSLAMQYYDSCQRKWFEHAITKSAAAGMFWIWLHPIMTFFLFGIGAGLKMANASDYEDKYNVSYQSNLLISSCMGMITLCFSLMRFAHLNFALQDYKQFLLFAMRTLLSALQIVIVHFPHFGTHGHGLQIIISQMVISVFGFNLIGISFEVFFADKYRQHGGTSKSWTQLELVTKDKEEKTDTSEAAAPTAPKFRGRINSITQWLPIPNFGGSSSPTADNKVYAMDTPGSEEEEGPPAHHAKAIDC